MKHLVIGLGEVGKAVQKAFQCDGIDRDQEAQGPYDVMHVCFPYSVDFPAQLAAYRLAYQPTYVVVHSTVPVGTCDALKVTHSPVRGKHPHLYESLCVFTKYIAGPTIETANILAQEFEYWGIQSRAVPRAAETEAGKLLDLMQYGVSILLEKEIYEFCKKHGLDFETVYTNFNTTYNKGYTTMGDAHVVRPVLKHVDGPIGGHCVVQMMSLLDSPSAYFIIDINKGLQALHDQTTKVEGTTAGKVRRASTSATKRSGKRTKSTAGAAAD